MKYKLKEIAEYRNEKISIEEVSLGNYISTENMIPNKEGIGQSSGLPNVKYVAKYKKGDILISNIRPYFKKIWLAQFDGGASNDVLIIRSKDVNNEYLYFSLMNDTFFEYMTATSKGTKMPRGDKRAIMEYELNLVERSSAEKIVNTLSSIEKKIEINKFLIANLEKITDLLFKHWFIDFEFPNEEGQPYKSSNGEMVESELGGIPKSFEVSTFDEIATIQSGATPSRKKPEYFTQHGIPWITPKDLSLNKDMFISNGQEDITEIGFKNSSTKLVPPNSILFSSRAPIGYIAINSKEATTNQGFKNFVPKLDAYREFIYLLLKYLTPEIEANAGGSTFKEVSGKTLKSMKVVVPNEEIINGFSCLATTLFEQIKLIESETSKLIKLRDILLPKLLSGEIEIPVEEPLSSLIQK